MTLYLQMDGVDDYLKTTNPVTFDEVQMEFKARYTATSRYYIDARTGIANSYIYRNTSNVDFTSGSSPWVNGMYWNGTKFNNSTATIPYDTRGTLRLVLSAQGTDDVSFFANNAGTASTLMAADVFSIKLLLGGVVQAFYDMSTGTVQDQSGNGRHATLTGGTWLDDGTGGGGGTALTLSLSDSITLSETLTKTRQGYLSLGDIVTLAETVSKRRQGYVSISDGITIGDSETSTRSTVNSLVKSLSDSLTVTDSITIRAMRYLTIFDLFSIVDSMNTTGGDTMTQLIKFKRGNEVDLPPLAEGEPAITLDTQKMFVGTPNGNVQIATLLVSDSITNLPIASKSKQFMICGVLGATGVADALYVCKKLSNDTYDWVQFV